MNNIFSEFISPRVSHLHHFDATIDKLELEYDPWKEQNKDHDILGLFERLSKGEEIELNSEQSKYLRQLSIFLWNEELFQKMNYLYPNENEEENIEYFIELISMIDEQKEMKNQGPQFKSTLIENISKHFYELNEEQKKKLEMENFYLIISHFELNIETEDSLFEDINEFYSFKTARAKTTKGKGKGKEKIPITYFYEQLYINNLSEEKFHELLEKVEHNEISHELWSKIVNRIVHKEEQSSPLKKRYTKTTSNKTTSQQFLFDGEASHKLEGIIRHLTRQINGNVHEKGIINVKASSEYDNNRLAKNVVDLDNKSTMLRTKDEENSWLMYDFKEKKVRPTHYSITSKPFGPGDFHPVHWVIEGSNTNSNDWKILDTRNGITSLNSCSVTETFEIQERLKSDEFYQFLRIRQTGKNAAGYYYLGFSALEFFGSMI